MEDTEHTKNAFTKFPIFALLLIFGQLQSNEYSYRQNSFGLIHTNRLPDAFLGFCHVCI